MTKTTQKKPTVRPPARKPSPKKAPTKSLAARVRALQPDDFRQPG